MVLITDDRDGERSSSVQQRSNGGDHTEAETSQVQKCCHQQASEDESLGFCDAKDDEDLDDDDNDDVYQEFEEYEDFSELPDTRSIASDDSYYPPDDSVRFLGLSSPDGSDPEPLSFFQACCSNNAVIVKIRIRQGVTEEEVRETDKNSRTGLIVACYQGYLDVVIALAQCPYVDVNWQDKEGNTALITATQAGHIMISNYLLNYFPGMDIERRNCHGFSALMKAAVQGRADCVRALMLAGGDMEARDYGRKLTPLEWALFTGRYETAYLMSRLMARPCAEQFCDSYRLEWPQLHESMSETTDSGGCMRRLSEALCCPFRMVLGSRLSLREDGALDHMVRVTTSLGSPFVATACHTVCPGSPPCVGKRRPAVQEILRRQRLDELRDLGPEWLAHYHRLFQNSCVLPAPRTCERRSSLQLLHEVAVASARALRSSSLLPLHLVRRSSVQPSVAVPRLRISKAPSPTYKPEKLHEGDSRLLQIPKWRYKLLKEERRKAEEDEK